MKFEDLQPGEHFMVVTNGMRGHFACEMLISTVAACLVFAPAFGSV